MLPLLLYALSLAKISKAQFPQTCPPLSASSSNNTLGVCPQDYGTIGGTLEAIHESKSAPTGFAIDTSLNIYLTYPRNFGPTPSTVTIATSFTNEEPWPSAEFQNCTEGADLKNCFVNVQNVVLDARGLLWALDSGIKAGEMNARFGAAKVVAFNTTTREVVRNVPIPEELLADGENSNDLRINNTLGTEGFAFITDASKFGSLIAIDLATGEGVRRLFNTTEVRADPGYVGSYNGEPIYCWNGTTKGFCTTASDGIALASGNLYWGVLSSRRFYYIPQSILTNFTASEQEVRDAVVFPGQMASEQAGFTADDKGRVYMLASEQNAIYYVDTVQAEVKEQVNQTPPGGQGLVKPEDYRVKTLVRNGLIQHADSAAIWEGWLYFCTNQLELGPSRQYNNSDNRKGPFRSYRLWIGAGPAV